MLQFLSFWLAAPELLGESTLKRLQVGLIRFVSMFPIYFFAVLGAVLGITMGVAGVYRGLNAAEGMQENDFVYFIVSLGATMTVYFVLLGFRIKIEKWISRSFGEPFIMSIINDEGFRRKLLLSASVLFSAGFLCQLIAAIFG